MNAGKLSLHTDVRIFLTIIATLILIGFLFVYSSSSVYALEISGSALFFVKRQVIGFCVGIVALCIGMIIPITMLKQISPFLFFCALLITALTLIPSYALTIHGSSRWLALGALSFQPSEIVKITLILYLAYFLEKKTVKGKIPINRFIFFCSSIALMASILLKQPDFGMTVTLLVTIIIVSFIAHARIKHIIITAAGLAVSIVALICFRSYRIARIMIFLNPWKDPQGAGFQIIQSLIAIGSGNWLGTGIAHSRQKFFYLPMQNTDFIFSIIAEETGLIGCLFLITLFMLFLYFGIRIAHQLTDTFSSLVVLGFTILINLQAIINMAVTTGLAPTKGIGLPFISYGNSSFVCYLFMVGVIINVTRSALPLGRTLYIR